MKVLQRCACGVVDMSVQRLPAAQWADNSCNSDALQQVPQPCAAVKLTERDEARKVTTSHLGEPKEVEAAEDRGSQWEEAASRRWRDTSDGGPLRNEEYKLLKATVYMVTAEIKHMAY